MELSNKKRKAIVRGYPERSIKELARDLDLSERQVRRSLQEEGKLGRESLRLPLLMAAAVTGVIICAGLALYSWISRPGPAKLSRMSSKMNVLVVTIDTLRADHLGCYGYRNATTPVIDALARTGVRFERAYAHQPITLPSHATIFTGAHSAYHGIEDNGLFSLSPSALTLAETLKQHGFTTKAVISSYVLHSKFGLNQGFDSYDDLLSSDQRKGASGFAEIPATAVSDRALEWLAKNQNEQWLLWLHYYDPHADYEPPEQFRKNAYHPYDGEIAYVDSELGRVINALDNRGLRDRTLIILTSDHGESLGEHGESTHALFLYEAAMQVPLIISLPGAIPSGRTVPELVSLMDVMPTILEVLEIGVPAEVQGRSLKPLLFSSPEDWETAPIVMETKAPLYQHGWSPSSAIFDGQYKYIRSPKPELYDLAADPREEDNLYHENQGLAASLSRTMDEMWKQLSVSSLAENARIEMDDETRARLSELGYFSGGLAETESAEKLPDVKDMIDLTDLMSKANELRKTGHVQEGISVLKTVLSRSPNDRRILNRLGVWHGQIQDYPSAEKYLLRVIEIDPKFIDAYENLSQVYIGSGQFDKARETIAVLLKIEPNSAVAQNQLGMIQFNQGDFEGAIKFFNQAVKIYPTYHEVLSNLGACYARLGDLETASEYFREAYRISPAQKEYQQYLDQAQADLKKKTP